MYRIKKYAPFVIFIILLLPLIALIDLSSKRKVGSLMVVFLDAGQGDSILIQSPSGNQMVIDSGSDGAVLSEISRFMSFFDRSIDIALATHPDKDHIGGFKNIFDYYDVNLIIANGDHKDSSSYDIFASSAVQETENLVLATPGMTVDLGGGAVFEILSAGITKNRNDDDSNTNSIVGRLVYGSTSMLFMADATIETENFLISAKGSDLNSDILKVGHHGSRTSTGEKFLSVVSPQYSIISAGKDNSYGHPHKEVLTRLEGAGSKILSTAESGSIGFLSDGKKIELLK